MAVYDNIEGLTKKINELYNEFYIRDLDNIKSSIKKEMGVVLYKSAKVYINIDDAIDMIYEKLEDKRLLEQGSEWND